MIKLSVQGVRGGQTKVLGSRGLVRVDTDAGYIRMDDFSGHAEDYKQREAPEIIISSHGGVEHKFNDVSELAGFIERAKARGINPGDTEEPTGNANENGPGR